MKTRAFIIENPRTIDISDAAVHGDIQYVFRHADKRSSLFDPAFRKELIAKLTDLDYDPLSDFIVIAGGIVPITISVSTLVSAYGSIKVLFYDSTKQCYVPNTLGDITHVARS